MAQYKSQAAILADLEAQTEGAGRWIDLCLILRRKRRAWGPMAETVLRVGGKWDRLLGCYVGPADRAKIIDLQESQVESARWIASWLEARRANDPKRARLLMLAGPRRGGKTWLLTIAIVALCLDMPGAITWLVSPTLDKREEIDRTIKRWVPRTWWQYFKSPQFCFQFVNGSNAKNITGEIPTSLKRGRADAFLVNEAQMMSREVATNGFPAIIDGGGIVFLAANPPQNRKGEWVARVRESLIGEREPRINGQFFELDPSLNEEIDHAAREDVATILEVLDPRAKKADHAGIWLPVGSRGYFKREWFRFVPVRPSRRKVILRYWDLAGSAQESKTGNKGDFACGVKMSKLDDGSGYCIEDVARMRGTPHEVRELVKRCAKQDGAEVECWIEQDPGQSGVDQIASYQRDMPGFTVRGRRKDKKKIVGAGPFSSQVQAGQVQVVQAAWTDTFVAELEEFPEGSNDDCVDAASGAFAVLEGDGGWGQFTSISGGNRRI